MNVFFLHAQEPEVEPLLPRLAVPHGTRLPAAYARTVVIRWGAHAACPPEVPQLNPLPDVLRALHPKSQRAVLANHGIKTRAAADAKQAETFAHEFMVPVFHLEALAVFGRERPDYWLARLPHGPVAGKTVSRRPEMPSYYPPEMSLRSRLAGRNPGGKAHGRQDEPSGSRIDCPGPEAPLLAGFRELAPEAKNRHVLRAMREAVKAVYALGLDYALVHIGIAPDSRTVVAEVLPAPALMGRLAELFAAAIARYTDTLRQDEIRQGPVVLGADPEFVLQRWDGRIVAASRFVDRYGPVGCDSVVTAGGRLVLPLMELRPEPSADPRKLAANLRQNLIAANRAVTEPHLTWLSGGMPARGLPLGGHIHFSNIRLDSGLLRVLDNYVALPLVLVEGESARLRRKRYGSLGDFRRQPHGGFEYRTLPSWLTAPELTAGVLCLAAVVAAHYRELPQRPLRNAGIQRYYYAGDKESLLPVVQALWPDVEATASYRYYEGELAELKERLLRLAPWDEQADLRLYWKIPLDGGIAGSSEKFMV